MSILRHWRSHCRACACAAASDGARGRSPKLWIQHAVRHPGRLRSAVQRIYGRTGFDARGRIRCRILREMSYDPVYGRSARLALRLRGFVNAPACEVRR